jgi:hypothetical protein
MQKPLALSIALCLSFTGCQVFEKSPTWETVTHVHRGDSIRAADPSSSYAEKLHRVLLEQHIVVTYQYHYYTPRYEEALGTRTAVVYRDNSSASYPWWLMDDRTANPVWLPNGELDKQLSFYIRRPAEVIEKKFYPAHGGSGKASVALSRPASARPQLRTGQSSQPMTKIAYAKPAVPQPTPPIVSFHHSAPSAPKSPTAVTRIQRAPKVAISQPKVSSEPLPPVAVGPQTKPFWSPPTVIDPVEQASDPAPRDEHMEKLFRSRNGTTYDRTSATDRRKMEQLKHGLVGQETSGAHSFRCGVDGDQTPGSHF